MPCRGRAGKTWRNDEYTWITWRLGQGINQLWRFGASLSSDRYVSYVFYNWSLIAWKMSHSSDVSALPFQPTVGQNYTTWWVFIRLWCVEKKSHIIFFITCHPTSGDSAAHIDAPLVQLLSFQAAKHCCGIDVLPMSWTSGIFFFFGLFLNFLRKMFRLQWVFWIIDVSAEVLNYRL